MSRCWEYSGSTVTVAPMRSDICTTIQDMEARREAKRHRLDLELWWLELEQEREQRQREASELLAKTEERKCLVEERKRRVEERKANIYIDE